MLGFHDHPQTIRTRRRYGNSNYADHALRQTRIARNLGPGIAAVRRFEDATAGAAALQRPGFAIYFPKTGVKNVWISRVDDEVAGACPVTAIEDFLPRLAAVP